MSVGAWRVCRIAAGVLPSGVSPLTAYPMYQLSLRSSAILPARSVLQQYPERASGTLRRRCECPASPPTTPQTFAPRVEVLFLMLQGSERHTEYRISPDTVARVSRRRATPSPPSPLPNASFFFSFRDQDDEGAGAEEKDDGDEGEKGVSGIRGGEEEVVPDAESRKAAAARGGGDGRRITTALELMETLVS